MYTALYRKWRPRKFEDVYGQEQVTVTLKNQLKNSRISHAYLLCGTRGTGKTSTAKLLAKAVNCKNPEDFNPCDACESCISINEGNSIDVFEIDAASNRGIDDIRDLREAIKFTPTMGKYKIYIIDEVHMLTNEAFNALLKTLEEPPQYVLFILATTEPHKLPATILSRCQRFDFKRISVENIVNRLSFICKAENMDVEEAAMKLIARNSDGALRDALSILDQCAVYGSKLINYDAVLEVLGIVNNDFLFKISEAVLKQDAGEAVVLINELSAGGKDINQFIRDLILHYRNLLMTKVVDRAEDVIDMSREAIVLLKNQAEGYNRENIIRCIRILSELENEAKWSNYPRTLLEIAVIKMSKISNDNSIEGMLERVAKLEAAIASGKISIAASTGAGAELSIGASTKHEKPAATKKPKPKAIETAPEVQEKWGGFIQEIKSRGKIKLRTYLSLAKPIRMEGSTLVLSFNKEDLYCKEALESPIIRTEVEQIASEFFCGDIKIKAIFEDDIDNLPQAEEEMDIVQAAIDLVGQDKVEVVAEE